MSWHLGLATVVDRSCGLALGNVDLRIDEELQLPPFLSLYLSLPLLLSAFYFSLLQIMFLHGMVSVSWGCYPSACDPLTSLWALLRPAAPEVLGTATVVEIGAVLQTQPPKGPVLSRRTVNAQCELMGADMGLSWRAVFTVQQDGYWALPSASLQLSPSCCVGVVAFPRTQGREKFQFAAKTVLRELSCQLQVGSSRLIDSCR